MKIYHIDEETINILKKDARQSHDLIDDNEDFDKTVVDYVGSHVDDAYSLGEEMGQTLQARFVLSKLGIDWND